MALSGAVAWGLAQVWPSSLIALQRLLQVTRCDEAVLVPFGTATRQIGVLYADRQGRLLDDEVWRAVHHFALQAGLAVTLSAADPTGTQAGF